eukprot:scaffold186388_cov29-Tisochrysis_lutea.AAC.6
MRRKSAGSGCERRHTWKALSMACVASLVEKRAVASASDDSNGVQQAATSARTSCASPRAASATESVTPPMTTGGASSSTSDSHARCAALSESATMEAITARMHSMASAAA